MKLPLAITVAFAALAWARPAAGQYYTWGSDPPSLKWSTIRTPDVRMIYPDTVGAIARRTLHYIRAVQPWVGYGFTHGPMRIPFVLHPENFRSNGLVMYLPKRVEFLTSPAVESYSMPWYKQLVAHEYRHAVQYNNLDRGLIRILSYLLGQQGSTIGLLCMPIWAMEGDAVLCETSMSSYGRGLQPSFSMAYRAMGRVGTDPRTGRCRRNPDRWFCGSYRDYIPDHYELGYQICSYAYTRYGENIWNKVARFGARNPYMIFTTSIALKKYYATSDTRLFRETFDDLYRFWSQLPPVEPSTTPLAELPEDNYTTYRWPQPLADTAVLALRSDFDRPSRFVVFDRRTGRERTLCYTGELSTRPALDGGRVWWTEYRRSKLFEQRVNSQLCRMDLQEGRPRAVAGERRALYATPFDGGVGWIDYDPDGRYALVVRPDEGPRRRIGVTEGKEVHGLAWDALTVAWYVLVTDDSGMWIARLDESGLHPITEGAYVTLSDLRAADGWLYYGSIASGRDEVHAYDLMARRACRLTRSTYGAFAPAPVAAPEGARREVLLTTYDRRGYRLAVQTVVDSALRVEEPRRLPRNVVNPPRLSWPVINLDTVRFTAADSLRQERTFRAKRYRRAPNLVNVHSWMPVAFDPFAAVDEHVIDLNAGVTLLSQNLLSNAEAFVSYGYNRAEGHLFRLGARYFGLGVHLDLDAAYGGNQVFYSLKQYDSETGKYFYQKQPAPDKYYSVGLSATLPLLLQQGYHTRQVSFSAGWNFSNGMVANLGRIEWKDGAISNLEHIGFRRGLHKIAFGAAFTDRVRLAHRDFAPRWGYTLSAGYTFNPSDRNFSDLVSLYAQAFVPGAALHHSVSLAATFQTSIGGYKLPSGYAPLGYRSTRLLPHGFTSSDVAMNDYTAFALNYQLPFWYPEGGIPSVLYFKRMRLNLGGDFALFRDVASEGMAWRRIWAAGIDLLLDVNLFRQPASATSTVKLSLYRPSSGDLWYGVAVGLPF